MSEVLVRPSGKWIVESDWPYGWTAVHDDYDGAPTYADGPVSDKRCFRENTREAVIALVDEYEEEHADA